MKMCEIELLILAIKKHPCLWDLREENYHNRDMKDLAWEEVCHEIFIDWETTDDAEKLTKCGDLKKKWNNVRDCYRKDINKQKNTPTGSSAKKQKRYVYADVLSFLAPIFRSRSYKVNYNKEEESSETQEQEKCTELNTTSSGSNRASKVTEERTDTKDAPNELLNLIKQWREGPVDDDDDTKFLLSFRTEMKAMSKPQKLDFKIGMLQLVKRTYESSPSSHYSDSSILSPQIVHDPSPGPQTVRTPSPSSSNH